MRLALITATIICMVYSIGQAKDNGRTVNVERFIDMTITFYCPCKTCCGKYGEKYTTADNTYFKGRFNFACVAADRKFYKMGTRFEINGKTYTMHDVGGTIKGNHLDVLVYPCADLKKCHKLALKLGKKKVRVKVYEKQKN